MLIFFFFLKHCLLMGIELKSIVHQVDAFPTTPLFDEY